MKEGCERSPEKRSRTLPVIGEKKRRGAVFGSPSGIWRAIVLIALTALMAAHFIQWRIMGTTVSPIEPSESMYTLATGAVNAGFIFFSLAILATLIFGRFVCGWGCHLVALQDLCAWLLSKIGIRPRAFRSRFLGYVPIAAAFYMFAWPVIVRYFSRPPSEPLIPELSMHVIVTDFWATFPPLAVVVPFLFICGFVTVYFLGAKGFCTYACPYGGVFGAADRLAPGKIRVTDACNQCGECTAVCTSNVIVHAEVKKYGMVVDPGCMKCFDCVHICPNDALYFGFGKPSITVTRTAPRNYDLSLAEELTAAAIFVLAYFAVWDTYQLVPMLMALGIACITPFLVIKTVRMLRSPDQTFHRWGLKMQGKLKAAGIAFAAFTALWLLLIVHSGFIRYNEVMGADAYANIRIPDELALARTDPRRWLSAGERQSVTNGATYLDRASKVGLFYNRVAGSRLAWMRYLSGDTDRAIQILGEVAEKENAGAGSLNYYYRGAMLNRTRRFAEAEADLRHALQDSPGLVLAKQELGESLWMQGRTDEAVAAWKDNLSSNPGIPLTNNFLAGALAASDPAAAAAFQEAADTATPNDPLFHWILGMRLQNVGMNELAEKHFAAAIRLKPEFRRAI